MIHEISHNIPSSKFAIIELIKNAYEAGASKVEIEVLSDKIVITDNGCGMSESDIDTLLVVSHSNKNFGEKVNGRIVSGEKGLGFFSAFKFGAIIEVMTYSHDECLNFRLDMEGIVNTRNLYDLDIPINKSKNIEANRKGTVISISNLNSETSTLFDDILNDETEYSKLLNVINDSAFNIQILKNGINPVYTRSSPDLENSKLALATFDSRYKTSDKYLIKLNRNGRETTILIADKFTELFETDDFSLEMEINFYQFGSKSGLNRNNVSRLYHDREKKRLIPLIYINNSLFDNYTMYNPEINTSRHNTLVFRQQTGEIKIYLRKPGILNFNADRTQMNESSKQKLLKEFLDFFSSQVQIKLREILDTEKNPVEDESATENNKQSKSTSSNAESNKNDSNDNNGNDGNKQENGNNSQQGIKVDQLIEEFIVLREYNLSDIFSFTDSQGGNKVKPTTPLIEPMSIVTLNNSARTLTFTAPCELITFSFELEDKLTKEMQQVKVSGRSVIKETSDKKVNPESGFIQSLMFSEDSIKDDVLAFKSELNGLFKTGKYTNTLVAGIRTFIELVVSDIMDCVVESKAESLNQNYQSIISKQIFEAKFIEKITDERDKKGIKGLYENLKNRNQLQNLINLFNLTTHNGSRLIGIEDVKNEEKVINLLYTCLCFVSKSN